MLGLHYDIYFLQLRTCFCCLSNTHKGRSYLCGTLVKDLPKASLAAHHFQTPLLAYFIKDSTYRCIITPGISHCYSLETTPQQFNREKVKNNHGKSRMELKGFHISQVEITLQKQKEKLHLGRILGKENPPVFRKNTNVHKKDLHVSRHEIKQILLREGFKTK